jgi:putative heme-binding domain-containing protein
MRKCWLLLAVAAWNLPAAAAPPDQKLPEPAAGWSIELIEQAPRILFPTAIVAAPDGTIYLGQDPMDMPGPPNAPIDSVVSIRNGHVTPFAEKLWSVMGLEWVDDTLIVVHAPYLSAFKDTNGDGQADERVDLMTGLGPTIPGFNGINDHVASGLRLGIDGYLYIAVGDKGIPHGVGRDGTEIQLYGGGVIRIRPDGSGLEIVSTGERNPLSVALSAVDDIFTYGNDDDSKKWPNSLTYHIVGGHYGYPYQFLSAPQRALPILAGQLGGSGTQAICYNEDGLPLEYRGNLFVCDWGLQRIDRIEVKRSGGSFAVSSRSPFVSKGDADDFRPFSLAVDSDRSSLLLVDWAFNGWLADGPKTGRLYRLRYEGVDRVTPSPRPATATLDDQIAALDHPALSIRRETQRLLATRGEEAVTPLVERLHHAEPEAGRIHALWALDAIGTEPARDAIRSVLSDDSAAIRIQAARSCGIRPDQAALAALVRLLPDRDAGVRRETAIALGRLGDPKATAPLMAALGESDAFVAWSIRTALRRLQSWDRNQLVTALRDERRREAALKLTDEAWAVPVVEALAVAIESSDSFAVRRKLVANLGSLYRRYPSWSGNWFGTNPLAGDLPRKTEDWDPAGMKLVLDVLNRTAGDADAGVRREAIDALVEVGTAAVPLIRPRLAAETDPQNLSAMIRLLGEQRDAEAIPTLAGILLDANRPRTVRAAALDALSRFRQPRSLTARLTLIYDPKGPADLVARALPPLARDEILPANDLSGFFEHSAPAVRAAALLSLSTKKAPPAEIRQAILARLDDADADVRRAAMLAIASLSIQDAVPSLIRIAEAPTSDVREEAISALCSLADPRGASVYLATLQDRNPRLRRAAESALVAIRDRIPSELDTAARSGTYQGPAALALERVRARFTPLTDWKVIGAFPRTTARVFVGEPSIDFSRTYPGAGNKTIAWAPRTGDARTGQVVIDDLKGGAGDRGGFGYDLNGSPDLCSFGYAEYESDRDRTALLQLGSSGSLTVTVNEAVVHSYSNFAGRPYEPDADVVPVRLRKGTNRILVVSRQGIGRWSFSVQISQPSELSLAMAPAVPTVDALRSFALEHQGDARKGEELFFDAKGIGCAKCHSAGGRGTASIGPDLTGLAVKYDKAELIRSVLEPSARLATGYQPVIIALQDGQILTGLLRSETDEALELVDSEARTIRVAKEEVDERRVGDVSIMPTGLVDGLSPLEFTDLISYLASLKQAPPAAASTAAGAP